MAIRREHVTEINCDVVHRAEIEVAVGQAAAARYQSIALLGSL